MLGVNLRGQGYVDGAIETVLLTRKKLNGRNSGRAVAEQPENRRNHSHRGTTMNAEPKRQLGWWWLRQQKSAAGAGAAVDGMAAAAVAAAVIVVDVVLVVVAMLVAVAVAAAATCWQ